MKIGMDIGTSTSSVCVSIDGEMHLIKCGTGAGATERHIPSAVYLKEDGTLMVGQAAEQNRMRNPQRFSKGFKRELGQKIPLRLGEKDYMPEELIARLIAHLKECAEKSEYASGKKVDEATICHPANFSQYKKDLLEKAARAAGIDSVTLLDEPTAAAYYYHSKDKMQPGEKLLIYDLGGGTFDISLMERTEDGVRLLTRPLGIDKCGGEDFDYAIYQYLERNEDVGLAQIKSGFTDENMLKMFVNSAQDGCVKAKEQLSFDDKAGIFLMFKNAEITRTEFEGLIKEYVDETIDKVNEVIKRAHLEPKDIDKILLVGGSCRIPYIKQRLIDLVGDKVVEDVDPDLAVVQGATSSFDKARVLAQAKSISTISAGYNHAVAIKNDGTVVVDKDSDDVQCDVNEWRDIVSISAGQFHTVALKKDGTVVAYGNNDRGQSNVNDWRDIVSVSVANAHTVGLKSDGTVVAVGDNDDGRCDVSDWRHIESVSAGDFHTVGLKADGKVVVSGENHRGQCEVSGWKDIKFICAAGDITVGLKEDGTVVAVGDNTVGQCEVNGWNNIVAVSANGTRIVGLKADGTVVAAGWNNEGQCNVYNWTNIVSVSVDGHFHTVGLKKDGTVVAAGSNKRGQCDVSRWRDIVSVTTSDYLTLGLKDDGTVVVAGKHFGSKDCNVSHWRDIRLPSKDTLNGTGVYKDIGKAKQLAEEVLKIDPNDEKAKELLLKINENSNVAKEEKQQSERICRNCGSQIKKGFNFCGKCGSRFNGQETPICNACGAAVKPGFGYCGRCGTRFNGT